MAVTTRIYHYDLDFARCNTQRLFNYVDAHVLLYPNTDTPGHRFPVISIKAWLADTDVIDLLALANAAARLRARRFQRPTDRRATTGLGDLIHVELTGRNILNTITSDALPQPAAYAEFTDRQILDLQQHFLWQLTRTQPTPATDADDHGVSVSPIEIAFASLQNTAFHRGLPVSPSDNPHVRLLAGVVVLRHLHLQPTDQEIDEVLQNLSPYLAACAADALADVMTHNRGPRPTKAANLRLGRALKARSAQA